MDVTAHECICWLVTSVLSIPDMIALNLILQAMSHFYTEWCAINNVPQDIPIDIPWIWADIHVFRLEFRGVPLRIL